ncbi:hypothetical protein [Persicobacter diffluens]|uniref:Transcriptional regulator n=1 Tax=Persicobacter diffluens TaxID=981 RepID=A0AAN4W2X4_9BACT|nr:transcriptional regulator [Persicobacter diffluens]
MINKITALFFFFFAATSIVQAQNMNDYIEMVRADVQAERKAIMMANTNLSPEESEVFWPIYDEYHAKRKQAYSGRLEHLMEYIKTEGNISDEEALELIGNLEAKKKQIAKLDKAYHKSLQKSLSGARALQIIQLESYLDMILQAQVMANLPVAQP